MHNYRDADSFFSDPDPFGSLSSELQIPGMCSKVILNAIQCSHFFQTLSSLGDAASYDRWSFPTALPSKPRSLRHSREDLPRAGNEWLLALQPKPRPPASPSHYQGRYRVTPALYSWDIYRVRLLTWRVDTGTAFDQIFRRVTQAAPNSAVEIFAAELGADHLAPVRPDHFGPQGPRGNFFLVCTPHPFVLRVSVVLSGVPDLVVAINPLLTVADLKAAIQKARGYPQRRMDLMFEGRILENAERLFLYDLRNGSHLKMVLQRGLFLPVHFKTFWEQKYDMDIDVTATIAEVVSMVVRRCTSPHLEGERLHENYVLPQALTLRTNAGSVLDHLDCVSRGLDPLSSHNFFNLIEDHATSRLVTLKIQSENSDEQYMVPGTEGSSMVPVFLRLHALTHTPIDLMTLVAHGCTLNPFDTLRTEYHGSKLQLVCKDPLNTTLLHPRLLRIVMPKGSVVPVTISQGGQIGDVKEELVRLGYTNARDYGLSHDDGLLNDNKAIHRCGLQDNDFLFLTRSEFPIDVASIQGKSTRLRVQDHSNLEDAFAEGDASYEPVRRRSQYVFCGDVLDARRTAGQSGLHPGNMIFQDRRPSDLVLEILFGEEGQHARSAELSLHRHSVSFQVRRLLSPWALNEATLEALEQAIVWRNFPRPATEVLRTREPTETREDAMGGEGVWDLKYGWAFHRPSPPPPIGAASDDLPLETEVEEPELLLRNGGLMGAEARAKRLEHLLGLEKTEEPKFIEMPPMQLHQNPLTVHYDEHRGIHSLLWTSPIEQPHFRKDFLN